MSQSFLKKQETKNIVFLSLGSNLGDKKNNLTGAISDLSKLSDTKLISVSSFYLTKPVGYKNQDDFLNCCLRLDTYLSLDNLFKNIQKIENKFGRLRTVRFGPRTLDIDILLFNNITKSDKNLSIPHPRMFERAFVLVPLLEIINKNNVYFDNILNSFKKINTDDIIKT
ncbi:MAG: 2-amino-4-hydroxy-6-hydroxymethyldihydropteridine diphosphokinase [Oscillospiraceae bacterium]|nr:2-amino-4-hydroxy-6-hydroxymethyldihydropteridine diphosphokinase [Oscillospiraceae bacterium]